MPPSQGPLVGRPLPLAEQARQPGESFVRVEAVGGLPAPAFGGQQVCQEVGFEGGVVGWAFRTFAIAASSTFGKEAWMVVE